MDQNLKSTVEFYREQVAGKMDTKVGNSNASLYGERPKCRLEECSFGNFLTDAMADEMKVKIAFVNSGSIKGSFDQGNLLVSSHVGGGGRIVCRRFSYHKQPFSNFIFYL